MSVMDSWFWADPDYSPHAGTEWFLQYRLSAATRNFTLGKSDVYELAAAARRGFNMVLFSEPSKHLCRRYMRSTESVERMYLRQSTECPSSLPPTTEGP